ncbi:RHS repeat-associated protein [Pantoea agglomerans]|jgi:RHS repeat-associated protein|uniref:RHS repeat domain-containing protein n=2 Tax=Enterobacter agglomerans TaxID=549 RepID=UPI00339AEBD4
MIASTDLHSGAFSFASFLSSGTDPRTGLYTATLTLPPLCAGALSGPDLPLAISYSPLNSADSGFGSGWALALSRFSGSRLSLHTGESFRVSGSGDEPAIPERRLRTFRFMRESHEGIPGWRIVHRSGVTEHLRDVSGSGVFLPVRVTSQEGRAVSLEWGQFSGAPFLQRVTDGEGRVLMTAGGSGDVMTLTLHPGGQRHGILPAAGPSAWTLQLSGSGGARQLDAVVMPEGAGQWRFTYETLRGVRCITAVESPTGATETIICGDDGHPFPGGGRKNLPRVTRHLVNPGGGQPGILTEYAYPHGNFLGLGADGVSWSDDGLDNLYRATGPYEYAVTETRTAGDTRVGVARTYNRFHLQTGETVTRTLTPAGGVPVVTVSRTLTAYHADEQLSFAQQPHFYQMPKCVTQQWYLAGDAGRIRQTTQETRYDENGNLTRRRDASGTVTEQEWYPGDRDTVGENGTLLCPADPQGFTRALAVRRLLPAEERDPALPARDAAPALETRFTYVKLPPAGGGDSDWLAESSVTLSALGPADARGARDRTLLKTTLRHWVNDPGDLTRHGLPLEVTETAAGQPAGTGFVTAYSYERVTQGSLPALRTTTRRFSRTAQRPEPEPDAVAVSITDNLLSHGEPARTWPDGEVAVTYAYDALGRLTEETVDPGGPCAATRRYAYGVDAERGLTWTERRRAGDGAASRTWYDGLGRVVRDERQDADAPGRRWRDVASVSRDALGRETATTLTDWEGDRDVVLTTRISYDAWGARHRLTAPDGTVSVTAACPVTLTQEAWTESADGSLKRGRVRTVTDEEGNPVSVTPLSADGSAPRPGRAWRYDGHGQVTLTVSERGKETRNAYDALGRPTVTTLPDESRVVTGYAPHSTSPLVASLTLEENARTGTLCLARQTFDGLERPVTVTAGSLTGTLTYEGASSRVKTLTRPSGRALTYSYLPALTDAPAGVTESGGGGADFTYHKETGLMTGTATRGGVVTQRGYERDGRGNLCRVVRQDGDAQTVTGMRYSREGNLLTRRAGNGPEEVHTWQHGRPVSITAGGISEHYTWDAAGSLAQSVRRAGDGTVTVRHTWDDQGREASRTVDTAQGEVTFSLTYHDDGRLATRERRENGAPVLTESFSYDDRGRLQLWVCAATDSGRLPRTPYGQPMVKQLISYDALDNVRLCRTTFLTGAEEQVNDARFGYDAADPDRLVSLTHSHPLWALPAAGGKMTFTYDADGNMTRDECGRTLAYDAQGRLLTVTDGHGELMRFRYDASGHLAGVLTRGDADEERREWDGWRLAVSRRGDASVHYLHGREPVGEEHREAGLTTRRRLFITDAAGSVTGEQEAACVRHAAYGAYGTRGEGGPETALGFNGEVRERGPGWYLLGNGYRVYNPVLMRFHSPDSESPLGQGGLNRYAYALGDPVNIHDPSGNIPSWLGWAGIGIGLAVGAALTIATGGGAAAIAAGLATEVIAAGLAGGAELAKNKDSTVSSALNITSLVVGVAGGFVAGGISTLGRGITKSASATDLATFEFSYTSRQGAANVAETTIRNPGGRLSDSSPLYENVSAVASSTRRLTSDTTTMVPRNPMTKRTPRSTVWDYRAANRDTPQIYAYNDQELHQGIEIQSKISAAKYEQRWAMKESSRYKRDYNKSDAYADQAHEASMRAASLKKEYERWAVRQDNLYRTRITVIKESPRSQQ